VIIQEKNTSIVAGAILLALACIQVTHMLAISTTHRNNVVCYGFSEIAALNKVKKKQAVRVPAAVVLS
jgi:hypothetical protein